MNLTFFNITIKFFAGLFFKKATCRRLPEEGNINMRDLSAEKNIIEIADGLSGDVHEFYYRKPTAQEIATHQAGLFERKGKKVTNRVHSTRISSGLKIITGFKPGTIGINGVAISPVPGETGYREDWKTLIGGHASDIVAAVAQQVFEGTGVNRGMDDFVIETEEGDAPGPLAAAMPVPLSAG